MNRRRWERWTVRHRDSLEVKLTKKDDIIPFCSGYVENMNEEGLGINVNNRPEDEDIGKHNPITIQIGGLKLHGKIVWVDSKLPLLRAGVKLLDSIPGRRYREWLAHDLCYLPDAFGGKDSVADESIPLEIKNSFERQMRYFLDTLCHLDSDMSRKDMDNLARSQKRREFQDKVAASVNCLESLAKKCDRKGLLVLKKRFRLALSPWLSDNSFAKRGLDKPRGYPGDFMMMEMAYEDTASTNGGLAGEFDRLFFSKYVSVINRKNIIVDTLRTVLREWRESRPIEILTLGGGPCREFYELERDQSAYEWKTKITLDYLDHDDQAVEFSRRRLSGNQILLETNFFQHSLLSFGRDWGVLGGRTNYDVVYALGIADYFPDTILVSVIAQSLSILQQKGKLILAHKDKLRFNFSLLDWICDWTFFRRGEQDVVRLVEESIRMEANKTFKVEIQRDSTDEIMFFMITRTS